MPPSVSKENDALNLNVVTTPAPNAEIWPSKRNPSHPPPSERNTGSVVYSDEVLSIEEELQYPNQRGKMPIFSDGAGAKGPLINQNEYPDRYSFFKMSPYDGPRTSESGSFWTREQAIYYSRVLYDNPQV